MPQSSTGSSEVDAVTQAQSVYDLFFFIVGNGEVAKCAVSRGEAKEKKEDDVVGVRRCRGGTRRPKVRLQME